MDGGFWFEEWMGVFGVGIGWRFLILGIQGEGVSLGAEFSLAL